MQDIVKKERGGVGWHARYSKISIKVSDRQYKLKKCRSQAGKERDRVEASDRVN